MNGIMICKLQPRVVGDTEFRRLLLKTSSVENLQHNTSSDTRGPQRRRKEEINRVGVPVRERSSMENIKGGQGAAAGGNGWVTVPAFGNWDMKNGALPDYSMDFSKIREMRKQNKKDLSRTSLGGDDDDLLAQQQQKAAQVKDQAKLGPPPNDHHRQLHGRDGSPTGRKTFLSYFQCCIKA
ncbi:hypothetical protein GUJ93_ZPchr0013g36936 [Zizania palustris]|uniref:RIN4 pathogenic type III effector avirulence factor Avr cleavage site domain-containing protein n=1 Tax=Zizania palustris TaxID=103762 RepID=A0A8J5WXH7_ZIZPA|nr:hypothetical protein GUJ93_ZPchr0013g36936 [Zizania palustris]